LADRESEIEKRAKQAAFRFFFVGCCLSSVLKETKLAIFTKIYIVAIKFLFGEAAHVRPT
jgi:hypothetical protein